MAKIPFDVKYRPQIESGEYKVETRDGHLARIICWDACEDEPIVAVVSGLVHQYTLQGYTNYLKDNDLFIVTPEPELTEFEKAVGDVIYAGCDIEGMLESNPVKQNVRESASKLLDAARKELVKQGYVIEKKAFHDAVNKVDRK